MSKFITIFCGIDERLLSDIVVIGRLNKQKFKPTKDNRRMFYKQACRYHLENIKKDIDSFKLTK